MVKVPGEDLIPNPQRPSNPFTPTIGPIWIEKPVTVPSRSTGPRSTALGAAPTAVDGAQYSVKPRTHSIPPMTSVQSSPTAVRALRRENTDSTTRTSSARNLPPQTVRDTTRKPPPPIPQKPSLLVSRSSHGSSYATDGNGLSHEESVVLPSSRQMTSTSTANSTTRPALPRRATSESSTSPFRRQNSVSSKRNTLRKPSQNDVDRPPKLPPRGQRSSTGNNIDLMDESDDAVGNLTSWQPLQPR